MARTLGPLLFGLLASCEVSSASLPSEEELRAVIAPLIAAGPGTIVSLDSVIRGDWKNVYVFGAYTPSEYINRCVGASVNPRGIGVQDGYVLLVLEPTRGSPSSIDVRGGVEFGRTSLSRMYRRGAASFIVAVDSADQRRKLVPASEPARSCS